MAQSIPSTKAEYNVILEQANLAYAQGNNEEYYRLLQQLPLAKHLAKAATKLWGEDFLQNAGFIVEDVRYADLPEK
jgi:hypothetical protein